MGMLRSSGYVLLIYISFIDIGDCFLNIPVNDKAKAEEKVNVHVVAGNRVKRSTDNNDFPETYDLELTLNGSKLHVHLVKNPKVKTSVPVWTLKGGSLKRKELNGKEESVFYQDPNHGAVFTVQKNSTGGSNMVGVLQVGNEDYVLQSNEDLSNGQTNTKFRITQETVKEVDFSDFNEAEMTVPKIKPMFHKRRKRATGDYQVELLVVVDFSIFQYWYDLSTAPTIQDKETDSIETIRHFYAFVINGMDAMYKNIQTSAYTMSIVFSGIVIAQTPSDSSWTETIKNTGVSPFQVDSSNGLSNFRTWVQAQSGSLPGHDHAMLFTKYDLTSSGSTSNAGLAYVGVVCTTSSQSIVEDHFGFVMLTVASHELGHSLSSAHDGTGNACSATDYYIMGPSSSPQQNSATATHPWIFSTCSTSYFTNYIDSLESSSSNCMATLDSAYNASALSQYDNQLPGQIYDADAQCVHIRGPGSYFCKDRYSSGFTTICNVLWCADPANPGYCSTSIAADGTHCGNQKWCKTGVCTYDAQAPTGVDSCLYGDIEGPVFSNQPWNCSEVASIAPHNCPLVPVKCCDACAPYLPSTTTTTTQSTTTGTGTGTTASPPTTPVPTTVPIQLSGADLQCEAALGNGSFLCRSLYNGDFSTICTTMYCSSPSNPSSCQSVPASDGTLCGNQKWCVSNVCTADLSAPTGDESCLYGDRMGAFFTNGWTCADMVANAPNNCPTFSVDCCASCAPYLSPSTTSLVSTTTAPTQLTGADLQCEAARGNGSFLCRALYNGDYSSICTTMWCSSPSDPSSCQSVPASDGTLCGNQKWCIASVCTADLSAPAGDETCLYGDRIGAVFTNGWTCADMVANAPNNCPSVPVQCCASCAPYLSTTAQPTASPTETTTLQVSTTPTMETSTTSVHMSDADLQCAAALGVGSFMCRSLYNGDFSTICSTMWCSSPTNSSMCQSVSASDETLCGNQKWCLSGVCTADVNAPTSSNEVCLYGDRKGAFFTNGWTCADMVAQAPYNCPSFQISCCASCAPYLTTTSTATQSTPETSVPSTSQPSTPSSLTPTTTSSLSTPPSTPTTTLQPSISPSTPTTTSQPSTPPSTPTTTSQPSTPPSTPTTTSQPSTPPSTTLQLSTPSSTLTTTSQPSTPPSTPTTTSQPSTPPSTATTTSQQSSPPSTPTTTSQPSTPPSTPTTTSQPSTPPSTPTTTSQQSTPPSTPTTTSQPSTPPLSPTTTSQASTPPSTPTTTSQPSTQPSTPTTTSQLSTPPSTPTTTSQPSTPPSTPTTTSQPSTPPSTPTTTSQPSTPPSTPTTTSQPSTPPSTPITTSQPSTPPSTPTTTSQPSTPPSTPTTTSQPSTPPSTPITTSQQTTTQATPPTSTSTSSQTTTAAPSVSTSPTTTPIIIFDPGNFNSGAMRTNGETEMIIAVLAVVVSLLFR